MYGSKIPLGLAVQPDEIAPAALCPASSESGYPTGTDVVAGGGFTQA